MNARNSGEWQRQQPEQPGCLVPKKFTGVASAVPSTASRQQAAQCPAPAQQRPRSAVQQRSARAAAFVFRASLAGCYSDIIRLPRLGVAVVRGELPKWSHTFVGPSSGGKNPHTMVWTGGGWGGVRPVTSCAIRGARGGDIGRRSPPGSSEEILDWDHASRLFDECPCLHCG
jgi:hypothetical protein